MTIGELRKKISNLPDNMPLVALSTNLEEAESESNIILIGKHEYIAWEVEVAFVHKDVYINENGELMSKAEYLAMYF